MKKVLVLIIIFINFLTVCFGAESKKFIVLLDWFANPNHAPLFVAKEKGFFKEEGLDVELIGPADPSDPPKLVAAGKADVGISYQPQFIEQVEQGMPLIRIGTLIDKPLNCLVVLKNGPIKSFSDLKNKHIGYSSTGLDSVTLKVMLENHKLTLNDIDKINVHYALTQALLSKKVDAVVGMMRNFELVQMELSGHPGRAFFPEQNGVPTYSELVFIGRNDKIHDPRLAHFLIALKKGVDYLQKHPEETWVTFAKEHPELNDELNRRAWKDTLPYFALNPAEFDKKSWLHFAHFMQQNGLIKTVQPIDKYAVKLK